jgi:hypothetical protein
MEMNSLFKTMSTAPIPSIPTAIEETDVHPHHLRYGNLPASLESLV